MKCKFYLQGGSKEGMKFISPLWFSLYYILLNRFVTYLDCKGNQIEPRSFLSDLMEEEGEQATCPGGTHKCCHEANIKRDCNDYSADGYKCMDNSE